MQNHYSERGDCVLTAICIQPDDGLFSPECTGRAKLLQYKACGTIYGLVGCAVCDMGQTLSTMKDEEWVLCVMLRVPVVQLGQSNVLPHDELTRWIEVPSDVSVGL